MENTEEEFITSYVGNTEEEFITSYVENTEEEFITSYVGNTEEEFTTSYVENTEEELIRFEIIGYVEGLSHTHKVRREKYKIFEKNNFGIICF